MTSGDGATDGEPVAVLAPAPGESDRAWKQRRALLREAAIQAEYATGRLEANEEEARRGSSDASAPSSWASSCCSVASP